MATISVCVCEINVVRRLKVVSHLPSCSAGVRSFLVHLKQTKSARLECGCSDSFQAVLIPDMFATHFLLCARVNGDVVITLAVFALVCKSCRLT